MSPSESERSAWITELSQPLSAEEPSGPWLRYSESFRQLEKLRVNERDDLPMGEWQRPLIRADWTKTAEACRVFLVEKSRDLHVASWLCEALTESQQLAGLETGLKATLTLVESQWESLWPALEADDPEARVAPFVWLNRQIPVCLRRNLVLLEPTLLRQQAIKLDDWLRWPAEDAGSERSKAAVRRLVQPDDQARLTTLKDLTSRCNHLLSQLDQQLDALLQADSPGFGQLRQLLETVGETAQALLQTPTNSSPAQADQRPPQGETPGSTVPKPALSGTLAKPNNRAEALALLQSAVESLQLHDPHSPATLLAARAALWGGMSLQQMAQFEASQGRALSTTLELLGVPMQVQDRS